MYPVSLQQQLDGAIFCSELDTLCTGSESLEVEQALVKKALFNASSLHDRSDDSSSASDDERAASGSSDSEVGKHENDQSSSGSLMNRGRGQALHPDSNLRGLPVRASAVPSGTRRTADRNTIILSAHHAQRSSEWRSDCATILLHGRLEQGDNIDAHRCQDGCHRFWIRTSKAQ